MPPRLQVSFLFLICSTHLLLASLIVRNPAAPVTLPPEFPNKSTASPIRDFLTKRPPNSIDSPYSSSISINDTTLSYPTLNTTSPNTTFLDIQLPNPFIFESSGFTVRYSINFNLPSDSLRNGATRRFMENSLRRIDQYLARQHKELTDELVGPYIQFFDREAGHFTPPGAQLYIGKSASQSPGGPKLTYQGLEISLLGIVRLAQLYENNPLVAYTFRIFATRGPTPALPSIVGSGSLMLLRMQSGEVGTA